MDLRMVTIGIAASVLSGCAGYEAMIIERPGAQLAMQSGVQVCERTGVRESHCQMVSHDELRQMFDSIQQQRSLRP
jgi:hypothetical protein